MKLKNIQLNISFTEILLLLIIYLRVDHQLDMYTTGDIILWVILVSVIAALSNVFMKLLIYAIIVKPLIMLRDKINNTKRNHNGSK